MSAFLRKIVPVILLCISAYISCTTLQAQDQYLITGISFEGNKTISSNELIENLNAVPTNWFQRSILGVDPSYYQKELFQEDLQNIIWFYQRKGFLNAQILSVEENAYKKYLKTSITVRIDEGLPILVNTATFKRISSGENTPTMDSVLNIIEKNGYLKKSEIFTDENLLNDEKNITEKLSNVGFPMAKVNYTLTINGNKVDINWEINPGPRSKFGKITFSGPVRTKESYLSHKLTFKEGDIFDGSKIIDSQKKLYDLGLFQLVIIKSKLDNIDINNVIPIEVIVKEAPIFKTEVGIGYGRDEKFRVSTNFNFNGPFGWPDKISIEAKHSALDAFKIGFIYVNQDFYGLHTPLRIKSYLRRQTEPSFEAKRKGIDVTVLRNFGSEIFASAMINYENVIQDTNKISSLNMGNGFHENYDKTGVTFGFNLNTSTRIFTPVSGMQMSMVFSYIGITPNSIYHYAVSQLDFRKYFTLKNKILTFAYKLNIGTIHSFDTDQYIPVEDRYFSGGSNSIRGWSRSMLGPIDSDGIPIGGNSLLENNVELRWSFTPLFGLVTFLDFGNVWTQPFHYALDELKYSTGVGFRYSTPIGPIRLDFAVPVFAGKPELQFWLSVGQAF